MLKVTFITKLDCEIVEFHKSESEAQLRASALGWSIVKIERGAS